MKLEKIHSSFLLREFLHTGIYIYIYIERERERQADEMKCGVDGKRKVGRENSEISERGKRDGCGKRRRFMNTWVLMPQGESA